MKSLLFFLLLFVACATSLQAQFYADKTSGDTVHYPYWVGMMQDPNANFNATQHAFEKYWQGRSDFKGNGWKVFKRWEYINQYRVGQDGRLPKPDAVTREYGKYQGDHHSLSPSGNWVELGPTTLPANATSQPNGMGRVNALAFHPANGNVIFAGAPSGGLWKTTNGGSSWIPLTTNTPTLGVSSVLIDPLNVDHILIGTGDRDHGDAPGLGVYKSLDGGLTWTSSATGLGNATVGMLIRHPANPDIILAATSTGIYKSIDGGSTWVLKSSNTANYKDIRFKPANPQVVYATAGGEFYRSSDTGETWTKITSGVLAGNRMVIGVSPNQPAYVYILQTNGPFAGLLRSTDSGLTFSTRSASPNIMDYSCDGSGTSSQAWYDLCISIDPNNAEIVYTGGVNIWKSTDGGSAWAINSHWVGSSWGYGCAPSVHADIHSLDWSPVNGMLYTGTDGGVYVTSDGGTDWTDISTGLAIAQVYKIGQSATNAGLVMNGFQDNGTASNLSNDFTTVIGGDGMECIIDYSDMNVRYGELYYGDIRRSTGSGYETIAANGSNGISESGGWVTPYILHETLPSTMFAGYRNVWRSTNVNTPSSSDVTWTAISSGETANCNVLEQSPANPDILYVSRGSVLKRTDNANAANPSWVTLINPGTNPLTDLEAHPTNPAIVYATSGTKVYKSTDKGMNWTDISGTLPNVFINCIVYDKTSNEGLYVGCQTGVFYKNALMPDWVPFSTGLPVVDVREIEIYYNTANPLNSKLKAATYGRGLWESDIDASGVFAVTPPVRNVGPMAGTATFTVNSPSGWTAFSSKPWCTVTTSGTGNGLISAVYTSNIGAASRTATIFVVGSPGDTVIVTVSQSGLQPPTNLQASLNKMNIHLAWYGPRVAAMGDAPHIPAFGGVVEHSSSHTGIAPKNPSGAVTLQTDQPLGSNAFGIDMSTYSTINFDVNNVAGNALVASLPNTTDFWHDMEMPANQTDYAYAIRDGSDHLYKVTRATGAFTDLGSMGNGTTDQMLDLAIDGNTGVIYGVSSVSLSADKLWKINPAVPSATLIGPTVNSAGMIGLAGDKLGNLWGYDLVNDRFYSVSKTTGLATVVGSIGFDANYGQCMFFDEATSTIMMAAYNNTAGAAQIRAVDVTTGASVMLSSTPDQIGGATLPVTAGIVGGNTPGLVGYNIYRNGSFVKFNAGKDSVFFDDKNMSPGIYNYQVTARYDLTPYGYPEQFGTSAPAGPVQVIITDTVTIGSGSIPSYFPFTTYWGSGRTQMLYKASELIDAGASAGTITSIGFNVISYSSQAMYGFNVKMGATTFNTLTGWTNGLTTNYSTPFSVPGTGWKDIRLTTPFVWDGVSNIIVEICYANDSWSDYSPVYGSLVPGGIIGHYQDNNPEECFQPLSNTGTSTPRPNIRFIVTSVVISPDNQDVGPEAGTAVFNLKSTGAWTAASHQSWCTVTPSGTGNGSVTAAFSKNLSATPRMASITVTTSDSRKYTVTVTQQGVLPPVNLQAVAGVSAINLSWNAPSGAVGLDGYNVYRYGVKINLVPVIGQSYIDSGLVKGIYKYTVAAVYSSLVSQHAGPVMANVGSFVTIGSGTATSGYPYYTNYMGSRTQMLYLAADLVSGGAVAGNLYSVGFNVNLAYPQVMQNFTIKMGLTAAVALTGWATPVMNTVYAVNYGVPGTGWRDIKLTTPFYWDGTSNIIVEICFGNNGSYTNNSTVLGTAVNNSTWHYHADSYAGCAGTAAGAVQTVLPNIRFEIDTSSILLQPPANLVATATGNNVHVSWNAPAPAPGLLGYFVYRNSLQVTPIPIASVTFDDPALANGTYLYKVSAVYPNGETDPIGPGTVIIALPAPPLRLIAGSGFKNCIPLNWSDAVSDSPLLADYYKVYRRIGTTGNYTLIGTTQGYGTFTPASCFVDKLTDPGTTCFYKVTGVTGGIETNFSNEVSAVSNLTGFEKTAAYSEIKPVIDGIIDPAEWNDATQFPVTNTSGVFNLPPAQSVAGYYKKIGNSLYIAAKDLSDVTNDADMIGLSFDNNSNGIYDGTDGNLQIQRITDSTVSIRYRQMSGTFPSGVSISAPVDNPAGVTCAISFNGGHREYEIKIDLINSPLHPVNNSFGNYLYTVNASAGYSGYWPDGLVWTAPGTYAKMNVIYTPAAAPVTTAATVEAPVNTPVSVPVRVNGFTDVTAFDLRLQYNPNVISYQGFANVASGLTGLTVYNTHLGPALHKLTISWSSSTSSVLSPGSKLLELIFNYGTGSSPLTWNTSSNGGSDCEYFGPFGEPLPDTPSENFYLDGLVQGIQPIVNLTNTTVEEGQDECFNATQILNVAGNGSAFIVNNGGRATLIAGQEIFLWPGTRVLQGGYLKAQITSNGIYCYTLQPGLTDILTSNQQDETITDQKGDPLCKVYPNPTADKFIVEPDTQIASGMVNLVVYGLMGETVLKETFPGLLKKELSLGGKPAGIYLLHISSGGVAGTVKIIKY